MTATSGTKMVRRFRDIMSLIVRSQVRTAYEIAQALKLPTSSTYLAVAELERLSCLARDESGYLLVGVQPQQIALDAMGYRVAAQQFPPLVRYLRDRTGETIFIGNLSADSMTVGLVAVGFNPGSLSVQPFQTFGIAALGMLTNKDSTIHLKLSGQEFGSIEFLGFSLAKSCIADSEDMLVVGTASAGERMSERVELVRNLSDAAKLFHAARA
jgi:hypothetical protein